VVTQLIILTLSFLVLATSPSFIKQPQNSTATICSSVTFECSVQSFGYVSVEWKKYQSVLPFTATVNNITSLNEVTSVLTITDVAGYYRGLYYCIATNNIGTTVSNYANLYVLGTYVTFVHMSMYKSVLPSTEYRILH